MVNSGRFDGMAAPGEAFEADRRVARRARRGAQEGQLQAPRLAHQPPALLGRAHPDRPLREVRHGAGTPGPAAGAAARPRGLPPHGRRPLAAGARRGVGAHDLPGVRRAGAPRDRHDGHLRLLELVSLPLRLAARRDGAVRPREGRVLAARRPVRRRRRARGDAPALRALLLQGGAGRRLRELRRALRAAAQPGDDPGRGRPEDEQEQGQRGHAGQRGREVRRRRAARATSCSSRRSSRASPGATAACRARTGSSGASGTS